MPETLLIIALLCSLFLNLILAYLACNIFFEWKTDEMMIKSLCEILRNEIKEEEVKKNDRRGM